MITGAIANAVSCSLNPDRVSIGASTSLCGLVGARLGHSLILWRKYGDSRAASQAQEFGLFLVLAVGLGLFAPEVDMMGHLMGGCSGMLIAFSLFGDVVLTPVATGAAVLILWAVFLRLSNLPMSIPQGC
mmetsp:Transcript_9201/g.23189  ORF Transcript_9201/g.23189 Transcript_9201/m.23189 type:complete len:130 (-) Transcript_9201:289-678(-)